MRPLELSRFCAVLLACAPAGAQNQAKDFPIAPVVAQAPVPKTYFAINLAGAAWSHPWPTLDAPEVRLFDSAWYHLEPARGAWDFAHLDADVARAQQHHARLDLILESPPTWASARPAEANPYPWQPAGSRAEARDLADWEQYVRTTATRYRGKVFTYELWNEPNQKDSFSGAVPALVALSQAAYRVLKQVDPRITVISPSPAPSKGVEYLGGFLAAGGGAAFDVLGFHLYDNLSDPAIHPEGVIGTAKALHALLAAQNLASKPVWDTESGYYIHTAPGASSQIAKYPAGIHVLDQDEAAAAVARSYLAGWAAGIGRFYWYGWAEPQYALVDDGGNRPKAATTAYTAVERWMVGARVQTLARSADDVWTMSLLSPENKPEHIVWTSAGTRAFAVPENWRASRVEDLAGKITAAGTAPLTLGPMPVLLR